MRYKIFMKMANGHRIDMPTDVDLTLAEAIYRIEIYRKRNPAPYYFIEDEYGNEIEL